MYIYIYIYTCVYKYIAYKIKMFCTILKACFIHINMETKSWRHARIWKHTTTVRHVHTQPHMSTHTYTYTYTHTLAQRGAENERERERTQEWETPLPHAHTHSRAYTQTHTNTLKLGTHSHTHTHTSTQANTPFQSSFSTRIPNPRLLLRPHSSSQRVVGPKIRFDVMPLSENWTKFRNAKSLGSTNICKDIIPRCALKLEEGLD